MADPRTRLSENKLMPSLLRSTGVTCAAIVPVAVVAIAVAIPFRVVLTSRWLSIQR